jgi:Mn2+/Fe2+ NRAMP family transporter
MLRAQHRSETLSSELSARSSAVFWRSFGPGLLWAAAAVGVSHLVQSTRAGAEAGLALVGVILLALVLKYPFFSFGPLYAAATGKSLVEGYLRIGRWALWLYLAITIATALIVQAAVVLFASFLVRFALGVDWPVPVVGGLLCAASALILRVGRFRLLDLAVKGIMLVLAVSTLGAAALALPALDWGTLRLSPTAGGEALVSFAFLLALAGWMPSAIDIAVWSSLWTLAKDRTAGVRATVRAARLDFLIGYIGTGVLALAFVVLGAALMHGSGETFSPQGAVFATQLVGLYAQTLGEWTRPVVTVAVLTTMLSTVLTVVDGFPRALARSFAILTLGESATLDDEGTGRVYWTALLILAVLTVLVFALFVGNLTAMVDFATTVSFVTAPVLGYLNLRAVTSPDVPPEHRPGLGMRALSYLGLVLLGGTGLVYLALLVR